MKSRLSPLWLALGASLLLHVSLLGSLRWTLPQWDAPADPTPFETRLVAVAVPEVPPAPPEPLARKAPPVTTKRPAPSAESVTASPVPSIKTVAINSDDEIKPDIAPDTTPVPTEAAPLSATPAPATPPLNPLPPRIDLRFTVSYGIASGKQSMVWVNEDGQRYTLISVAEATGMAGAFYRGQFVQTSRGRITPHGLQPEEFRDQRGDKRSSAQFDAAQGQLTLSPAKGEPKHFTYTGEVQDALSLFFQLALTAPPPTEGTLTYTVFNGKKLRDYSYTVRGEELLDTALGSLRALHLVRVSKSDDRFEAWLAIDRHYLPVRVLSRDDKGNEVELKVQSITP